MRIGPAQATLVKTPIPVRAKTPSKPPILSHLPKPLIDGPKEEFLAMLDNEGLLGPSSTLRLDKVSCLFPSLDPKPYESLLEMLTQPRQIKVAGAAEDGTVVDMAVTFAWIELLHYLKQQEPSLILKMELFGSTVPKILGNFAEKVAQALLQNPNYKLNPSLLRQFAGDPADTDFRISINSGSVESYTAFKHHIINFIATKADPYFRHIPYEQMQKIVETGCFHKCNVPKNYYANAFATFSLQEIGPPGKKITEFVILQRSSECAFLQDDLSLSLGEIIQQFPEEIFRATDEDSPDRPQQQKLADAKENLLKRIREGSFKPAIIHSQNGNLWQICTDLITNTLRLPQVSTTLLNRWIRLVYKCAKGKFPVDGATEKAALESQTAIADKWPQNRFSLPAALNRSLDKLADNSGYAEKWVLIAAHNLERHFGDHNVDEFDTLIATLCHASATLQRHGNADYIPALWHAMQPCIAQMHPVRDPNEACSFWEAICGAMSQAPEHFDTLMALLEVKACLFLTAAHENIPHATELNACLTTFMGKPAFQISDGPLHLFLPAKPASAWQRLYSNIEVFSKHSSFDQLHPFLPPHSAYKGSYASVLARHQDVLQIDCQNIIKCLEPHIEDGFSSPWAKLAAEGILSCSALQANPVWFKWIKSWLPCLLEATADSQEAERLMQAAINGQVVAENSDGKSILQRNQNTPCQLVWANLLLSMQHESEATVDADKAYKLWMRYRASTPAAVLPIELEIAQRIGILKPHLLIPMFYTIEQAGYQSLEDQKKAVAWMLAALGKPYAAQQTDLFHSFFGLLPAESQKAFFRHALQMTLESKHINRHFPCLFSLYSFIASQPAGHIAVDDAIRQKLLGGVVDHIDHIDPGLLLQAGKLAVDANLLTQAELLLLKALKNKQCDQSLLGTIVVNYLSKTVTETSAQKILEHHEIEKLLNQSPQKAIQALLHVQKIFHTTTNAITPTTRQALRLCLNLCHAFNASSEDYRACMPLVERCLKEPLNGKSALKTTIQICQNRLLDALLEASPANRQPAFGSLLFYMLNKNMTAGVTNAHIDIALDYFSANQSDKKLLENTFNHRIFLSSSLAEDIKIDFFIKLMSACQSTEMSDKLPILRKEADLVVKHGKRKQEQQISLQTRLDTYYQNLTLPIASSPSDVDPKVAQMKIMLANYLKSCPGNLLKLCKAITASKCDPEIIAGELPLVLETLGPKPYDDASLHKVLQLLDNLAQDIYQQLAALKKLPDQLAMALKLWFILKNVFLCHLNDSQKRTINEKLASINLLMHCFTGFDAAFTAALNQFSLQVATYSPITFNENRFLFWQTAINKELSDENHRDYALSLVQSLMVAAGNDCKHMSKPIRRFFKDLLNTIPLKRGMPLLEAFLEIKSAFSMHCALVISEKLLQRGLNKEIKANALLKIMSLIERAHQLYPSKTKNYITRCLKAGEDVFSKDYVQGTWGLLLKQIGKELDLIAEGSREYIKKYQKFVAFLTKGAWIHPGESLVFTSSATDALATLCVLGDDFPQELMEGFFDAVFNNLIDTYENKKGLKAEQIKHDIFNFLTDGYLELLDKIIRLPIQRTKEFKQLMDSANQLVQLILARNPTRQQKEALFNQIIMLAERDFADSCFDFSGAENAFSAYQKHLGTMIAPFSSNGRYPLFMISLYGSDVCKKFGNGELLANMQDETDRIAKRALLPGHEKAMSSTNAPPTGYAEFRRLALLINHAFEQGAFKGHYDLYLRQLRKLMPMALAYTGNERLFNEMKTILADCLCAGSDLTPEEATLRTLEIFRWQNQLNRLHSPLAKQAAGDLIATAKHREIMCIIHAQSAAGFSLNYLLEVQRLMDLAVAKVENPQLFHELTNMVAACLCTGENLTEEESAMRSSAIALWHFRLNSLPQAEAVQAAQNLIDTAARHNVPTYLYTSI